MYLVFQAISAALHLLLLCSSRLSKNLGLFGLFLNSVNYVLTPLDCMKEGTLGSAADSACFYKALAAAGTFLLGLGPCWMEEWTWVSLEQVTFRHTSQRNAGPLKVLQEALRAERFLSVKDTIMLDLAFQAVSTTTRTNSEWHLPTISAVYSRGRQGCQIPMDSPKISALDPACKCD